MQGTHIHLLVYIPLFLLLPAIGSQAAELAAWSEYDAQGAQVYAGATGKQQQPKIVQLTKAGTNITPAIAANNNVFWIVWVDRAEPENYELNYTILDKKSFSVMGTGKIPTSDNRVYAPSVMLDTDNRLWVAWSGFDGHDSEIRLIHFRAGKWSGEATLSDNGHSDTRPQIGYDSDQGLTVWWHSNNHGRRQLMKVSCRDKKNKFPATVERSYQPEYFSNRSISLQFIEPASSGADGKSQLPAFLSDRKDKILMGTSLLPEQE